MRVLWKLKKDFNPFIIIITRKNSLHKLPQQIIFHEIYSLAAVLKDQHGYP